MYAGIAIRPLTQRILLGLSMIVLISAIAYLSHPTIGTIASTLSLVIGVLLVGASQGLIPGLVAATAAFLFFNFFMADPILTLRLESGEDLAPLIAFNVTALIAGVLSGKLRDRAAAAERATAWSQLLIEAGNEVQALIGPAEVDERLRDMASRRLGLTVEFALPDSTGQLSPTASPEAQAVWASLEAKQSAPRFHLSWTGWRVLPALLDRTAIRSTEDAVRCPAVFRRHSRGTSCRQMAGVAWGDYYWPGIARK